MTLLDIVGRVLQTNTVRIEEDRVIKQYRAWSPTMLWAALERKAYSSAQERYERERNTARHLYDRGLNVSELLKTDPQKRVHVFRRRELRRLADVLTDPSVHHDDRSEYARATLHLLYAIHGNERTHGDPYLKNFHVAKDMPERGPIFTCDFEQQRTGPNPEMTDVLILVASLAAVMGDEKKVLDIYEQVYGVGRTFPFDVRDRAFYRARFGVSREFFRHFETTRHYITTQ